MSSLLDEALKEKYMPDAIDWNAFPQLLKGLYPQ
jgi:hypothetical protein